jgi:hypothetical protein
MNMRNAALVAFAITTVPIAAAVHFVHRDLTSHPEESLADHIGGGGTLGDERFHVLTKITRAYVAGNADAPAAMRNGTAFAPEAYLNQKLASEGVKWRVRHVKGLAAETYNVT